MREIGDIVRTFERRRGEPFALATLVRARGSSYRRPGARMLIGGDGSTVGSLSGGCLEDEVVGRSRLVLETGKPVMMEFDTRRRFGCHGALEILVERADDGFLCELAEHFHARRICRIVTGVRGSRVVDSEEHSSGEFFQTIEPPLRLLVIGDGPDSTALHSIASVLGWQVRAFGCAHELGNAYDSWTAAVVKTHNYGRDLAVLHALMPLGLRYIGLLGPRSRRDQLLGDLIDAGVECGPNFFAPAGLDLGGESPEIIALSIITEIQAVFARGTCQPLRDLLTPIHAPRLDVVSF